MLPSTSGKSKNPSSLPQLAVAFLLSLAAPDAGTSPTGNFQLHETAIAYVGSSTTNREIRLINPDGSQDRLLWRIPSEVHPPVGIGRLSWHPDGTRLLFDSDHDWQRSLAIRDLYTLSADGQTLSRVTNPPGPDSYARYQSGTVSFILDALEQGDVQLYITGASEPVSYFARLGESYRITQTVADLGKGIRQYMRLYDPDELSYYCNYSEEGWVDVIPNETVDFGRLRFGIISSACPYAFSASWSHDGGRILYLMREAGAIDPPHNIWLTSENADINSNGARLLDMNRYVGRGSLYRAVLAPTAARGDELLFLEQNILGDNIVHTTITDATSQKSLDLGSCPYRCSVLDLVWLPDGSGIIVARLDRYAGTRTPPTGTLYRYTFADRKLTTIVSLPNEVIGRVAVAPDGRTIVFERGRSLKDSVNRVRRGEEIQCPCELWTIESDGSDLRQLTSDGRAPAWSPVAISDLPSRDSEVSGPAETEPPKAPNPPGYEDGGGGAVHLLETILWPLLLLIRQALVNLPRRAGGHLS